MDPDELRRAADALEQRLKAGRPGRHQARVMLVGRLIAGGRLGITMDMLKMVRRSCAAEPDAAELLSWDLLLDAGYEKVDGGLIAGPSAWPGNPLGAPPLQPDEASPGAGPAAGSGGGTVSRSEARRQVTVARTYADWREEAQRQHMWEMLQERRAALFGRALLPALLRSPPELDWIRKQVPQDAIELWSDADLRADYRPEELGEGSSSRVGGTGLAATD